LLKYSGFKRILELKKVNAGALVLEQPQLNKKETGVTLICGNIREIGAGERKIRRS
jgi:hypothetical protein